MWNELIKVVNTYEVIIGWLALASLLVFLLSLLTIPYFIVRIPADYFSHHKRHRLPWSDQHPLVRLLFLILKNLLGLLLIALGFILLFLPGQGVLTVLVGVLLINFPGKYRFERWLIARPAVLSSVNWLRRRYNKPLIDIAATGKGLDDNSDRFYHQKIDTNKVQ